MILDFAHENTRARFGRALLLIRVLPLPVGGHRRVDVEDRATGTVCHRRIIGLIGAVVFAVTVEEK